MWQLCASLLLACSAAVVSAEPVTYKDCGSVDGVIVTVEIIPCPTQPCTLKHGTNMTVKVTFTANKQCESLKSVVHGIIAGVPIPFPIPQPDSCSNQAYKCPVEANSKNVFSSYVYVDPSYPKLRLVIKWEIIDQNSKDLFCFLIPATISD